MVKIKSFKVRESRSVALPRLWMLDLALKPGDHLDVYRDRSDRLIIVPPGGKPIDDIADSCGQARELAEFVAAHLPPEQLRALAARESGGAA